MLKSKFSLILLVCILVTGCSKKKKNPGLKFNPRLALITSFKQLGPAGAKVFTSPQYPTYLFVYFFFYCFATERKSESTPADQQRGTKRGGSNKTTKDAKKVRWRDDEESSDEESDSTVDSEDEISLNKAKQKKKETQNTKQKDFEVVPIEDNSKYIFLSKCATMFYPV